MKFLRPIIFACSLFLANTALAEVNINTASATEIAKSLKGIGIKKAEAIVKYRQKNGSFNSAQEVMQVKGIGPKLFASMKNDITVSGKKLTKKMADKKTKEKKNTTADKKDTKKKSKPESGKKDAKK